MLCKSFSLLSINLLFCIILFQIGFISVSASLTCRDETGKAVDWYLLYKLPSNKDKKNGPGVGIQYMYITPNTVSNGWILSKKYITNATSIPAYTLKPLYNKTTDMLWILYNDQPPKGEYGKYKGHTKGVVGADKTGGFWLVHSVPRFPPSPPDSNNYSYPFTGYKFGQSFLCITLKAGELDNVGLQLQYNQINVYWANISDTLAKKYPKLSAAGNGTVVRKAPWTNLITITTQSGHEFFSFAKTSRFKKDLYEDWVASELKTDLYVETWPNGAGRLSSNCSLKYSVKNVEQIKVCQVTECSSFESTRDHSKWAVSTTKTNPWLCVGDINRALSQGNRGGGTVCLRNATIWESYYNSVAEVQACQRNKGLHDNITVISV